MDIELIPLSQLNETHVRQLAKLHHEVIHTLLSDLGLPIVLRYYQTARSDTSVISICAINSSNNEILGWAIGSPHPDRINSRLRTPFVWFVIQMLRLFFTRPLVLWQLISSVPYLSSQQGMDRGSIELTYIGVALSQRGQGLGKVLLKEFIEAAKEKGCQSVVLSVETDNEPAIALYEVSGFRTVKTYSEGSYQRHRMELVLE